MLRYRPTEIRLTAQDVEGTSRRLAERQTAGNARNALRHPPHPANPGPRIRRGPERSRDDSIIRREAAFSPTPSSAWTDSTETSASDEDSVYSPYLASSALTELLRPQEAFYVSEDETSSGHVGRSDSSNPEAGTLGKAILEQDKQEAGKQTSPSFSDHHFGFSGFGRSVPQYDGTSERPTPSMSVIVPCRKDSAVDVTEPSNVGTRIVQRLRSHSLGLKSPLHQSLSRSPSAEPDLAVHGTGVQPLPASQADPVKRPPIPYRPRPVTFPSKDGDIFGSPLTATGHFRPSSPGAISTPKPTIRLVPPPPATDRPRPTTERAYSKESVTRHSLPLLPTVSPFGPLTRPKEDEAQAARKNHDLSRKTSSYFSNRSSPDLMVPQTAPQLSRGIGGRPARRNSSIELSSASSGTILDLLRQGVSPLERLEQTTYSQSLRAPSASRSTSSPQDGPSGKSSTASETHRMPTFESPEHSPVKRKPIPPRHRIPPPSFAELPIPIPIPNTTTTTTPAPYDPLTSAIGFGTSPPSLDTSGFDNRYPPPAFISSFASNNPPNGNPNPNPNPNPRQPTSMPSLHATAPHQYRRRTAAAPVPMPMPVPARRASRHVPAHAHGHAPNHPWVRSAGNTSTIAPTNPGHGPGGPGTETAEARRNTLAGSGAVPGSRQQRRSQSTRFPSWQDEQENSGHAERVAMMAEVQRRRAFVDEASAQGRLDRTPPGLGVYERRVVDG